MRLETLLVHAGREVEPGTGAVTPSITLSTTFERAEDGSFPHGNIYTRSGNPNRAALESALAALEGGSAAFAFASGMAATAAVLQTLGAGAHVILPDDLYHGTRFLVNRILGRWGLAATYVNMTGVEAVQSAVRPETKLVWVETPSNPLLKIADIARIATVAHGAGAVCVVDNTWATPIYQHPLALGADVVMHATTKYLGGHSDLLGGCLIVGEGRESLTTSIREIQNLSGAVPSPFDCWLLLRSLPTLAHRVRVQTENATRLAQFLADHNRVEAVHYPGLESHAGHEIAARQMSGYGGMLSFQVAGDKAAAMAVAARVKLFTRATSLGGVESLIEHRASVEGPESITPPNLLRVSVGLEHPDDLIEDIAQALA